jgi:hypothetical protein
MQRKLIMGYWPSQDPDRFNLVVFRQTHTQQDFHTWQDVAGRPRPSSGFDYGEVSLRSDDYPEWISAEKKMFLVGPEMEKRWRVSLISTHDLLEVLGPAVVAYNQTHSRNSDRISFDDCFVDLTERIKQQQQGG